MSSNQQKIYRIAITGPESTGKSTLASKLAEHYQTNWVPEYAREYIEKLKKPYEETDLVKMARGQLKLESKLQQQANRYLFCDTELLVIKIWSEYKYGNADPKILSNFQKTSYDLYLLLDIDLPWQYDPQREHPDKRKFFFSWFEQELIAKKANYKIVSGSMTDRLQNAIGIIDKNFSA